MKNLLKIAAVAAMVLSLASCNKATADRMATDLNKVTVHCNPEMLTLVGGVVKADLEIIFPKGYFDPAAKMMVTPVIVCSDGTAVEGPSFHYQGSKIKENGKLVPAAGSAHTEKVSFDYRDCMLLSHLELRATVFAQNKNIQLPPIVVADGVCTTVAWADLSGYCGYVADNYQAILKKEAKGKIMYNVGSAKLRKDQLKSESVEWYQDRIAEVKEDDRYTIKGTKIVSYTSPEGGKKLNDKLSGKRSDTAQKAWKVVGKGMEASDTEIESLGQDWEGFKAAVEKSDIKDKDLILRVLAMYNDPVLREKEIRNLSQIYSELKKDVFPKLRRSQFVTELDFRNYSEEDLAVLASEKIYMLDEEGLLRLASVTENTARKEFLYNFAFEKFGSQRAAFNLAVQAYKEDRLAAVVYHLDRAKDEYNPAVINLRGLIEMCNGNDGKAEDLFEKAGDEQGKSNLGVLYLSQGKFEKAAGIIPDGDPNKPVACIMAGQYDKAEACLMGVDARTNYLRAIIAARKGNKAAAASNIASAIALDKDLKKKSDNDIEFAKCR